MNNIVIVLALMACLAGCSELDTTKASCDVNTNYTANANEAKHWIVGEWKLVAVTAMVLNPPVENLRLVFSTNRDVTIIRDDKPIETVQYEVLSIQNQLFLKTPAEPRADNWYVRSPALRICSDELFLDGGIAMDGPGYKFRRVK